jgi:hypothetical protein
VIPGQRHLSTESAAALPSLCLQRLHFEFKVSWRCNGVFILPDKRKSVPRQKGADVCTLCGAKAAFRSHRKHFFEFLRTRLTGKVPFRCIHCKRRFWLLIDPHEI